ncbi:hypothetical protein [uncultured Gimesia sp.]|uniref:hypothetical protein n=1 Tax=uncultured Gimesia sp. TaxID=1678688 RepID=UPI0030DA50B7
MWKLIKRWIRNARYRQEYRAAERQSARIYLEQLNNGCNPLIEMLWKIINGNNYKLDEYYASFGNAIDYPIEYNMRALRDDDGKFGTSTLHDPSRYVEINVLGKCLAEHISILGSLFWCDGPLGQDEQETILSHIRSLNKLLDPYSEFTVPESQLAKYLEDEDIDRLPERLARTWLFMIKSTLELVNKLVYTRFIA